MQNQSTDDQDPYINTCKEFKNPDYTMGYRVRESMENLPTGRTNRKDEMRASSLLTYIGLMPDRSELRPRCRRPGTLVDVVMHKIWQLLRKASGRRQEGRWMPW